MNIETVSTKEAPEAIGPYSQAKKVGGFVYCSGQVCFDPKTMNLVEGGVQVQTERVIQNIEAVLKAAGTDLSKVFKTTCFLKNMGDFAEFNEIYGKYFGATKPARSTVEVARLPKDVLVEIEVIAVA